MNALDLLKEMFRKERNTTVTFTIEEAESTRSQSFYNIKTIIKNDEISCIDLDWQESLKKADINMVQNHFVELSFQYNGNRHLILQIHITE